MSKNRRDPWLTIFEPSPQARLRLFCFPFAGGGTVAFRDWSKGLPKEVEVCSVQLPGRGIRHREPCFTRLPPMVEATAQALLPYFDRPFAFFGHSLGALVAFELARHLRRQGVHQPIHLFASGRRAPQVPGRHIPRYNLPEPELIEMLRNFEGTPPEILAQPEIMALLLPTFRADFEAHETYSYTDEPPLGCPISAYGGTDDSEVSLEQLQAWQEQTSAAFSLQLFHGGHFFVNSQQWLVLRSLRNELQQLLGRVG